MNHEQHVRQWVLQSSGLRIEPMMGRYLLDQAKCATAPAIAVMGGDARTGVPVRRIIPAAQLKSVVEGLNS